MVGRDVNQGLEMVQKPESDDIEPKERRIDLSVPQVAGSAVASVAAAVAASQLGVYGTILGAGVMSVVATSGGPIFQHFFRRTGEQIREVTVQAKNTDREASAPTRETDGAGAATTVQRETDATAVQGETDATTVLREVDATTVLGETDATTVLREVDATAVQGETDATTVLRSVAGDPDRTQLLRPLDGTQLLTTGRPDPDEEFTEATTHGTRVRGWKRSALGAVVVFVVAMAGITTFELISGNDLSGGEGTTVGSVVRGGEQDSGSNDQAPAPSTDPGQGQEQEQTPGQESDATPGTDSQGGQSWNPDSGQGDGSWGDPTPTPRPSDGTGGGTSPAPTAPPPSEAAPGDGGSAAPNPTGGGDDQMQGDGAATGTGTDTGQ
jgi:hypothetical protein